MKKLAPLALLLLLGLGLAGSGSKEAPAPGPGFVPNPALENASCVAVVAEKPVSWAGVDQGDVGQVEWLARVAFHRTYGRWPSNSPAELDRLGVILGCVSTKLLPPPPIDLPPVQQPGDPLLFDLTNNWGGLPMVTRQELARIELASQIPGIARFLGVKAWQAWRANQPIVTPAQAAALAAANPQLCKGCFNPADGPGPNGSAALLKKNTDPKPNGNGWQSPTDYAGWAAGSYGLFDLLGASAVHAGVHQNFTPLVTQTSAAQAMARWDVQGFAASYYVYRLLYSEIYKVLVPGAAAPNGNSAATWSNIAAGWLSPNLVTAQNINSPATDLPRQRFIERAGEIGVNLSQVAYPWPPGVSYATWSAQATWNRLQSFASRPVVQG